MSHESTLAGFNRRMRKTARTGGVGGLTGAIPSVRPDQLGQDILPQLTYRLRHALRAPLRRPTAAAVILRFNFSRAEALFE